MFAAVTDYLLWRALFEQKTQRALRFAMLSEWNGQMQRIAMANEINLSTLHMMHRRAVQAKIARSA